MTQAIQVLVVNLARRPDRLERLGARLARLGIGWERIDALDVLTASTAELDAAITTGSPLGRLGDGDRACTVSHLRAWSRLVAGEAPFALVLEDDAYLTDDTAEIVASVDWIPPGIDLIKLEKFGEGASTLLLGPSLSTLPGGARTLHRLHSRHVGAAAYIISRRGAVEVLKLRGPVRVPIDHLLFNATVSAVSRRLKPTVVFPAMATQRRYGYDSDVSPLGKAVRPQGWRRRMRSLKRGFFEVRLLPQQLFLAATGQARLTPLTWEEAPASAIAKRPEKAARGGASAPSAPAGR